MTRLLHLFSSSGLGGTERSCLVAIGLLDRQQFSNDVLFVDSSGLIVDRYRPVSRMVDLIGDANVVRVLARLLRHARRIAPDIVLAYGFRANALWRLARLLDPACRKPAYILALRNTRTMQNHSRVLEFVDRVTTDSVDLVFANSYAGLDSLKQQGYRPRATAVAANGVDTRIFHPTDSRQTVRDKLSLPRDAPIIICVANLRPVKRHCLLLDAFSLVLKSQPSAILLLVGQDLMAGRVQAHARRLSLGERARFLGSREDVAQLLQASDVFALASEREGISGAVQQAMATALPVVATDVGGLGEVVTHGVNGYLAASASPDEIARGIVSFLSDQGWAATAGAAARERMLREYSLDHMREAWVNALSMALQVRDGEGAQS